MPPRNVDSYIRAVHEGFLDLEIVDPFTLTRDDSHDEPYLDHDPEDDLQSWQASRFRWPRRGGRPYFCPRYEHGVDEKEPDAAPAPGPNPQAWQAWVADQRPPRPPRRRDPVIVQASRDGLRQALRLRALATQVARRANQMEEAHQRFWMGRNADHEIAVQTKCWQCSLVGELPADVLSLGRLFVRCPNCHKALTLGVREIRWIALVTELFFAAWRQQATKVSFSVAHSHDNYLSQHRIILAPIAVPIPLDVPEEETVYG